MVIAIRAIPKMHVTLNSFQGLLIRIAYSWIRVKGILKQVQDDNFMFRVTILKSGCLTKLALLRESLIAYNLYEG